MVVEEEYVKSLFIHKMRIFICVSEMCNYTSYYYKYNLPLNLIFHTCIESQCNTVLRHIPGTVYMPNNCYFFFNYFTLILL